MSANWYPIIDKEKCVGCWLCVNFCPHGVLAKGEECPEVVAPLACVEFCRGCQKVCDADAIRYAPEVSVK